MVLLQFLKCTQPNLPVDQICVMEGYKEYVFFNDNLSAKNLKQPIRIIQLRVILVYTMFNSNHLGKPLVIEWIVSYNVHYLFPAGCPSIKVSLQASALLHSSRNAIEMKLVK